MIAQIDSRLGRSLVFEYDDADRLLAKTDYQGDVTEYLYDGTGRLTSEDNDAYLQVSYDEVGNRDTETRHSGALDYIYGAAGNRLDEIRWVADNSLYRTFNYDDNGAVTAKKDGTGTSIYSLDRNERGQIELLSGPGFTTPMGYDARGMRIRRANSLYHLEGEHLEAIYSTGGELQTKYLRGAVIDEVVNGYRFDAEGKATNHTFHHDQVTSVIALSGHNGSFEQFATYYPFGEDLGAYEPDVNSLRFTGRERDPDTGLYYYRARYYDPEIGRFLSEDPLGFDGGDVNLYAYVGNNPLNRIDPHGEEAIGISVGFGIPLYGLGITGVDTFGSLTLVAGRDPAVNYGAWSYDLIYTHEVGAGVGDPFPSAFLRGVGSLDPDVVPESFKGFGTSVTIDAILLSGSVTHVAAGNIYEFGLTTPSGDFSVSEGYGISVPSVVKGAADFFTGNAAAAAASYPSTSYQWTARESVYSK